MNIRTILVLASGHLGGKQLGPGTPLHDHPAELPDGCDLALERIRQQLQLNNSLSEIVVVVDNPMPVLRPMRYQKSWRWLTIPPQISVLASLEKALSQIKSSQVVLQPITTLPPPDLPQGSWIGFGKQSIPREDWSAMSADKGTEPIFLGKRHRPTPEENDSYPFTGLIAAPVLLLRDLLAHRHKQRNWSLRAEHDLMWLAERLYEQTNVPIRLEKLPWLDLGHRATAARRRLSRLSSRGFNQVSYCPHGDLIRKNSSDVTRLKQEAAYFQSLPEILRRFFPACIAQQDGEQGLSLELEYIPFPSLAELFLHWKIGANAWLQILRRLEDIRRCLAEAECLAPPPQAAVHWLYSQKLKHRQEQLKNEPPLLLNNEQWSIWWENEWTLELRSHGAKGKTQMVSLPRPGDVIADLFRDLPNHEATRPLQLIHGDLCFNNILAEPLSGSIRLIDPRGERPESASWPLRYGDPRYDQVKILHSSRYLYDIVVNNLFELEINCTGFLSIRLDVPDQYEEVDRAIRQTIVKNGLSTEEERLLTASLFLSMLPLHREDGERCLILTAIGMLIFTNQFDAVLRASGQTDISI